MRFLSSPIGNTFRAANAWILDHVNPINPHSTISKIITHSKTAVAAVFYFLGFPEMVAAEMAPVVFTAVMLNCYQVNDGADHYAALLENTDQGPELKSENLVQTGCVTKLGGTTLCETMLASNQTLQSLGFCEKDACLSLDGPFAMSVRQLLVELLVDGAADNDHYIFVTNTPSLGKCLDDHGFSPGSNDNVCFLPDCSRSLNKIALVSVVTGVTVASVAIWCLFKYSSQGRERLSSFWTRMTGQGPAQPLLADQRSPHAAQNPSSSVVEMVQGNEPPGPQLS